MAPSNKKSPLSVGRVAALITIVSTIAGIVGALYGSKSPEGLALTMGLVATTTLLCLVLLFVAGTLIYAVRNLQIQYSPALGGKISFYQAFRLYLPFLPRTVAQAFGDFQVAIVNAERLRSTATSLYSDKFKIEILEPLLLDIKNTVDTATGLDNSVQVKLFPSEEIRESVLCNQPFDVYSKPLEQFAQVNPKSSRARDECNISYKIFSIPAGSPESLNQSFDSFKRETQTPKHWCVSSAYNQTMQSDSGSWIANDLRKMERDGDYYTDSPYFKKLGYNSQALFLLCREPSKASDENLPIGVLVFESRRSGRYDCDILQLLGSYFSSRLCYFLTNSIKAIDMQGLVSEGEASLRRESMNTK